MAWLYFEGNKDIRETFFWIIPFCSLLLIYEYTVLSLNLESEVQRFLFEYFKELNLVSALTKHEFVFHIAKIFRQLVTILSIFVKVMDIHLVKVKIL
jgi:hypothetical protein